MITSTIFLYYKIQISTSFYSTLYTVYAHSQAAKCMALPGGYFLEAIYKYMKNNIMKISIHRAY